MQATGSTYHQDSLKPSHFSLVGVEARPFLPPTLRCLALLPFSSIYLLVLSTLIASCTDPQVSCQGHYHSMSYSKLFSMDMHLMTV